MTGPFSPKLGNSPEDGWYSALPCFYSVWAPNHVLPTFMVISPHHLNISEDAPQRHTQTFVPYVMVKPTKVINLTLDWDTSHPMHW